MKPVMTSGTLAASLLCAGFLVAAGPAAADGDYGDPTLPQGRQPQSNWQPGRHWGWLNGRDASGGEGWIDDAGGRSRVTSRDERRAVLPGYHWGWLNGRDASGGAGWLDDRTGRPLASNQDDGRRRRGRD